MKSILDRLYSLADTDYKEFQSPLIPTQEKDKMIGVRTPALRSLAKELKGTAVAEEFMKELPHAYFEENQLHAFIISDIKDYDECLSQLEIFLPYVDNWATCDQMNPKALKKCPKLMLEKIKEWLKSDHTYTVRFGIKLLMNFYLEEEFDGSYLELVSSVESDEYYVKMMVAWYFATALAKQYDATIPYLQKRRLPEWTHKKAIQKACESNRITMRQKVYLKSLL